MAWRLWLVHSRVSLVDCRYSCHVYIYKKKTTKQSPVVSMLVQYVPEKRREEKGREGRSPPTKTKTRRDETKCNGTERGSMDFYSWLYRV